MEEDIPQGYGHLGGSSHDHLEKSRDMRRQSTWTCSELALRHVSSLLAEKGAIRDTTYGHACTIDTNTASLPAPRIRNTVILRLGNSGQDMMRTILELQYNGTTISPLRIYHNYASRFELFPVGLNEVAASPLMGKQEHLLTIDHCV
jgi:hypothetical protein